MGDVADILGLGAAPKADKDAPPTFAAGIRGKSAPTEKKAKGPKQVGMSREVYNLTGKQGLPPSMPTKAGGISFKRNKGGNIKNDESTSWSWELFSNSARHDSLQLYHWAKSQKEEGDYSFIVFNVEVNKRLYEYTDEEYEQHLKDDTTTAWSREDTDQLMRLCSRYNLCWPVIADRFESSKKRTTPQLQGRFYGIVEKLKAVRAGENSDIGASGVPCAEAFNMGYEEARRNQLELAFNKSVATAEEEEKLREDLKTLEAQIKKLRQKKDVSKLGEEAEQYADATKNIVPASDPAPGVPFLQSARLNPAAPNQPVAKGLLKKVSSLLAELSLPEQPTATRAVCDLMDAVKRDAAVLLTLQKVSAKKDQDLIAATAYQAQLTGMPHIINTANNIAQGGSSQAPPTLSRQSSGTGGGSNAPQLGKQVAQKRKQGGGGGAPSKGKRIRK